MLLYFHRRIHIENHASAAETKKVFLAQYENIDYRAFAEPSKYSAKIQTSFFRRSPVSCFKCTQKVAQDTGPCLLPLVQKILRLSIINSKSLRGHIVL